MSNYEHLIHKDLQGDLEMAKCTISESLDKAVEFKDFVKQLPIEVYDYKNFQSRVEAIFNESFKELIKENPND